MALLDYYSFTDPALPLTEPLKSRAVSNKIIEF